MNPDTADPFDLVHPDTYRAWRDRKLAGHPVRLEDLVVEVRDPRSLTPAEHGALLDRCRRANMAVYVSRCGADPDKSIPAALGRQFGLVHLDHNWLADEDAITPLAVSRTGARPGYIPYTDRPIRWHTDGYYNPPGRQVRGLLLHCVHPAARGGENALLDPEIAYIHLRDTEPAYIEALMHPRAMTIPARKENGVVARAEVTGPVFSLTTGGDLHMRYTARRHNIRWRDEAVLRDAVACLERLLAEDHPAIFRARLEPGMGLLSNNVLHDRAGFEDLTGHPPRLLYRARYHERIHGTVGLART